VRVSFLDPKPGQAAKPDARTAVIVPTEAVRTEGQTAFVFVYAGDRAERREVTLGEQVGGNRHVLRGLREGERVVLSPPPSLRDGALVRVQDKV
jgi:multidrug efflux pump subunit AcrA (membrane-fusion protein)